MSSKKHKNQRNKKYYEADDAVEDEATLQEAFVAGWKAKQNTAGLRTRRGFVPPRARATPPPPADINARTIIRRTTTVDERKEKSRCADCGKYGHWKGDPECSKVKAGERAPYKKEERNQGVAPPKTRRNQIQGPIMNWVGMALHDREHDRDPNEQDQEQVNT